MAEKKARLPQNKPAAKPPGMILTQRDIDMLVAIWRYEGVVSKAQLQKLFAIGRAQLNLRLGLLYHNKYIHRIDDKSKPEANRKGGVYWLAAKGARVVAEQVMGEVDLDAFSYRRSPDWQKLTHNLLLNDLRMRFTKDIEALPGAKLRTWLSEYQFRRTPDVVTYQIEKRVGKTRELEERKKEVVPDGFFYFTTPQNPVENTVLRHRFLLELDMGTETGDNQFGRDKVLPLSAYIRSDAYKERFGGSGRILVIANSTTRFTSLRKQIERFNGTDVFYLTTLERIHQAANVLLTPIWTGWAHGHVITEALLS